jgi:hypothetical protein
VLSHLLLADNLLRDEEITLIAEACALMPSIRLLNIAGNDCHAIGATAVQRLLDSHCALEGNAGIRDLDISSNPLGNRGILQLNNALRSSQTLTALNIAYCTVDTEGMDTFQRALRENPFIVKLDIRGNPCSKLSEIQTVAEAAVNRFLVSISTNPMSVQADKITSVEHHTLAAKLRFLSPNALAGLHTNPSFNVPLSEMREALHLQQAPGRKFHFQEVFKQDPHLAERLDEVRKHNKRMYHARRIYTAVIKWYAIVHQRNLIKRAIAAAKKKQEEENRRNQEDDIW